MERQKRVTVWPLFDPTKKQAFINHTTVQICDMLSVHRAVIYSEYLAMPKSSWGWRVDQTSTKMTPQIKDL